MNRRYHATMCGLALLVAACAWGETPPNEKGFAPEKLYQFSGIDAVDLFSGSVSLVIPIGPSYPVGGGLSYGLKLLWNSNVWDMEFHDLGYECKDSQTGFMMPCGYTQAYPNQNSNAGMGWWLMLGGLFADQDSKHSLEGRWTYMSSDGARHTFWGNLHQGEAAQTTTVWLDGVSYVYHVGYTRDGSYLRERIIPDDMGHPIFVDYPDGTTYRFECYDQTGGWNYSKWHIKRIEDRFGNFVSVDYQIQTPEKWVTTASHTYQVDNKWVITDNHSRVQTVYFSSMLFDDANRDMVVEIDLVGFGPSTTATYLFDYDEAYIQRNCKDDDNDSKYPVQNPTTVFLSVPLLRTITLPDASSYTFPEYMGTCNDQNDGDMSGLLTKLMLPTGGGLQWAYQEIYYSAFSTYPPGCDEDPSPGCPGLSLYSAGIQSKRLLDRDGVTSLGQWTYYNASGWTPYLHVPEERRVIVRAPDSKDTAYYFRAYPADFGGGDDPYIAEWNYGLPYTRRVEDSPGSGRFLSVEYFDGLVSGPDSTPVGQELTGAPKKRSVFVSYRHDMVEGGTPAEGFEPDAESTHMNRYLVSQHTVYHDDVDAWTGTDLYDFDGLGHHRVAFSRSNLASGQAREARTNYNPDVGTYEIDQQTNLRDSTSDPPNDAPGHSYAPRAADAAWVLDTYDSEDQVEGSATARIEYKFEWDGQGRPSSHFLERKRVLKSNSPDHANPMRDVHDLLAAFTNDGHGNVGRESYYGGDTQPLDTGSLWLLQLPSQPAYRIDHTYSYGTLALSQYVDNGAPMPFFSVNRTIDANTGLVATSADSAGLTTAYTYNAMGRLTWERPQAGQGACTEYVYTRALGADPAKVDVITHPNLSPTGCATGVLAQQQYVYDAMGRPFKERRLLPIGWSKRLTEYDGLGRKTSVSELQGDSVPDSALSKTSFQYDLFGRQTVITPPDGAGHAVSLDYVGARQTTRHAFIAINTGGESQVTTSIETYDGQGRLASVDEYSDPTAPSTPVKTTYTYDVGNRLMHASTPVGGNTQNRYFQYDDRGFLTSEQLPEVGPGGNGTVSYTSYDARGHLLSKNDGLHTLSFAYDRAERMTAVTDAATGAQRTFTFDKNLQGQQQGYSLGKLVVASSYAPDITFPVQYQTHTGTTTVTESYTYAGVGGATSQKDTHVTVSGSSNGAFDLDKTFTQTFAWTDLGKLDRQSYPSLPAVAPDRTVYDGYANGYLTAVLPQYASSITYHPNGMMQSVVHGNGVIDSQALDPNAMARPASISTSGAKINGGPGGDWSTGAYGYDGAGNIKLMGGDTFTYDSVSRLTSASVAVAGVTHTQTVTFDPVGNITAFTNDGAQQPLATAVATNRLQASTYDNAGNMLGSGGLTFGWDSFNQLETVQGTGIARYNGFTAEGERVLVRDQNATMITLRGLDTKVLRDATVSGGAWSWSKDYVYRDGALLASVSATDGVRHYTLDHLGTPRLVTNRCGDQVKLFTYLPFGQEVPQPAVEDASERMRFTVHERDLGKLDAAPGDDPRKDDLDYMHARTYSPNLGRFMSLDRGRSSQARSPQTWNRFGYAVNSPLMFNDPEGERVNPVTGQPGINPVPENGTLGRIRSNAQNPHIGEYGYTRTDSSGAPQFHAGIDINAPTGTGVVAAEGGTVTFVGAGGDAGTQVQVTVQDGTTLFYCHLSGTSVTVNSTVTEGQVVGQSGTSGNAQGLPANEQHLHFSVHDAGANRVNPSTWLNTQPPPPPPPPAPTPPPAPDSPSRQNRQVDQPGPRT